MGKYWTPLFFEFFHMELDTNWCVMLTVTSISWTGASLCAKHLRYVNLIHLHKILCIIGILLPLLKSKNWESKKYLFQVTATRTRIWNLPNSKGTTHTLYAKFGGLIILSLSFFFLSRSNSLVKQVVYRHILPSESLEKQYTNHGNSKGNNEVKKTKYLTMKLYW